MRKLRLTRDPLADLAGADLARMPAGSPPPTYGCTFYPTVNDVLGCFEIDRPPIHSVDNRCTT